MTYRLFVLAGLFPSDQLYAADCRVFKKDLVVATSRLVHIIASIRQWDELFFLLQPWRGVFFSFFPLSIENRCRPKLELDLLEGKGEEKRPGKPTALRNIDIRVKNASWP